jgi:S1-C subfamily serine protease
MSTPEDQPQSPQEPEAADLPVIQPQTEAPEVADATAEATADVPVDATDATDATEATDATDATAEVAADAPTAAQPQTPPNLPWPAPAPHDNKHAKRLLAIVAIVALVVASAGIGAAVASAFDNHSSRSFSSAVPNTPRSPFSDPFGSGSSGSDSSGSDSQRNGSSANGDIDVQRIADEVTPAVVNIFTEINNGQGEAAGTGIVISSDGDVLTNNHVIANATRIRAQIGGKGSMHDATAVGYDVGDDIALIKIEDVSGLTHADLGDAGDVKAGDPIVAIGNALGRGGEPQVVSGVVAALDQSVTAGDGTGDAETLHGMIQIDAPIQSGDSGGPLVNADGEVIGVNTAASVGGFRMESAARVAFSIPIDKAMSVVKQIESGDEKDGVHIGARGLLGVEVRRENSGNDNGFPFGDDGGTDSNQSGATVAGVTSGGPADHAGIEQGDVITSVDGKAIDSPSELSDTLADSHPGDKVKVGWVDGSGNDHSATVRLASGPPA